MKDSHIISSLENFIIHIQNCSAVQWKQVKQTVSHHSPITILEFTSWNILKKTNKFDCFDYTLNLQHLWCEHAMLMQNNEIIMSQSNAAAFHNSG